MAIGGGDDVGGVEGAALEGTFVAACLGVWIDRINGWVVTGFAVGCVGAVGLGDVSGMKGGGVMNE